MVYVYYLRDWETEEIRYVGITVNPTKRANAHRRKTGDFRMEIVSCFEDPSRAKLMEVGLIRELRAGGASLLNVTAGGDGVTGYTFTEEARIKCRAARARWTPEMEAARGAKLSVTQTGRIQSEETREKIRLAKIGIVPDDTSLQRMSDAQKRMWTDRTANQRAEHIRLTKEGIRRRKNLLREE